MHVAVLISAFHFLDRLVRHEYQFHRDAWEGDGRPTGYLFRPPESTWIRSRLAFGEVSMAWLFWTPLWVREDATAKNLLSSLRWRVLAWNVGILILGLLIIAVLLPETSNHALELTAARCMFTFSMATFFPPDLPLGFGGRSSAYSR